MIWTLDQTAPEPYPVPGFLGFRKQYILSIVWVHLREGVVCLQWEPPRKHRAPPTLRQSGSLSLWGSAWENKGLLILPESWGSLNFLHPRLEVVCGGERKMPPRFCEPPVAMWANIRLSLNDLSTFVSAEKLETTAPILIMVHPHSGCFSSCQKDGENATGTAMKGAQNISFMF